MIFFRIRVKIEKKIQKGFMRAFRGNFIEYQLNFKKFIKNEKFDEISKARKFFHMLLSFN